jgi:WD40 repeat protein
VALGLQLVEEVKKKLFEIAYNFLTDATVRIWDLDCVTSSEESENVALAILSNHTKSVNTVRWSRDGTFLASGSDDCYLLIYKLEVKNKNIQPTGFQSTPNKVFFILSHLSTVCRRIG